MDKRSRPRVVVTGMGAVTPLGIGVPALWDGLMKNETGVGPITRFDAEGYTARIGAEVRDFQPEAFFQRKEARGMDRYTQFALVATDEAMKMSGLDMSGVQPERVAVVAGTAIGGIESIEEEHKQLQARGPRRISPHFLTKMIPNMAAAQISIRYGAEGPNETVVTACATGANAVGTALRMLRLGEADAAIVSGADAVFTPLVFAGLCAARAVSIRNDDPQGACRPFDKDRDGMVLGEGAGTLILETLEHAQRRGATILAEVAGFGTFGDAHHLAAPAPDGRGERRSMALAIADACLTPEAIGYLNAHATGTVVGDEVECAAIRSVFGEHANQLAVSSTKGATGHLMGAAGTVELIVTVQAIQTGMLPPTRNLRQAGEGCDLHHIVDGPRAQHVKAALSNSFGFGGQNASVVVTSYEG